MVEYTLRRALRYTPTPIFIAYLCVSLFTVEALIIVVNLLRQALHTQIFRGGLRIIVWPLNAVNRVSKME